MNTRLALLAIIEILAALSIGVLILFATYKLVKFVLAKRVGFDHHNQAYGIFIAAILFSVGYMVSSVIQPLLSLFRILATNDSSTVQLISSFVGIGALYIMLAFFMALLVCGLGVQVYTYLTPINEFQELKNNNLAVALLVASIIITLTLLSRDGVALLIESLVPYPEQFPK